MHLKSCLGVAFACRRFQMVRDLFVLKTHHPSRWWFRLRGFDQIPWIVRSSTTLLALCRHQAWIVLTVVNPLTLLDFCASL